MSKTTYEVKLHPAQNAIWQSKAKIRVCVSGRRFGKSYLGLNELLRAVFTFKGKMSKTSPQTVLATMPTATMCKKVLWNPLLNILEGNPLVKDINRTDRRIDFKGGYPSIIVAGANDSNGDRLRGLRLWFVLCDEVQDISPNIFDTVIQPAMADTPGSKALLTGTPKGRLNWLYGLYNSPQEDLETFHFLTSDNPHVPRSEIRKAMLRLPPRIFRQEYEASFEAFTGKVFDDLSEENLVDSYSQDDVFIGVDFGDINPAICVLGRNRLNNSYCYLTGWNNASQSPVSHSTLIEKVKELTERYNASAVFCDPSRPSVIKDLRYVLGQVPVMEGFNRVEEGVAQVETLIYNRRLLFLKSGKSSGDVLKGFDAYLKFEAYRRVEVDGIVTDKILPHQDDHIVDAVRYTVASKYGVI